jgi:hypothetical protein
MTRRPAEAPSVLGGGDLMNPQVFLKRDTPAIDDGSCGRW